MASSGFSFDASGFKSPQEMDKKINRAIFATAKYWDGRIEAAAKKDAPWTDRTSNARNGLHAEAVKMDGSFAIILSHAVTYGIYLELPHSHSVDRAEGGTSEWTVEARPIIMPTINAYAPKVMRHLNKLLDRLS